MTDLRLCDQNLSRQAAGQQFKPATNARLFGVRHVGRTRHSVANSTFSKVCACAGSKGTSLLNSVVYDARCSLHVRRVYAVSGARGGPLALYNDIPGPCGRTAEQLARLVAAYYAFVILVGARSMICLS